MLAPRAKVALAAVLLAACTSPKESKDPVGMMFERHSKEGAPMPEADEAAPPAFVVTEREEIVGEFIIELLLEREQRLLDALAEAFPDGDPHETPVVTAAEYYAALSAKEQRSLKRAFGTLEVRGNLRLVAAADSWAQSLPEDERERLRIRVALEGQTSDVLVTHYVKSDAAWLRLTELTDKFEAFLADDTQTASDADKFFLAFSLRTQVVSAWIRLPAESREDTEHPGFALMTRWKQDAIPEDVSAAVGLGRVKTVFLEEVDDLDEQHESEGNDGQEQQPQDGEDDKEPRRIRLRKGAGVLA